MGSAEYRAKNREALAAKQRAYRLANLDRIRAYRQENADAIRDYQREYTARWRAENADKIREDKARAYREDPDAMKVRVRRWETANRNRVRARQRARARLRYVAKDTKDYAYIEVLANDPCCYCGGPCEHIDHIEPLARRGANQWDNLTAACGSCNRSKRDRPLLSFLLSRAIA